jgi:predicted membrane-bound dolichyl-phosphate-mannose-protein mannosyltransferase
MLRSRTAIWFTRYFLWYYHYAMKSIFRWFTYKENIIVCVLALAVLAVHLAFISNPPTYKIDDPAERNYIGDEVYYVAEANNFLEGTGMERPEHVPLGKWLIAGGIWIFGDNTVGWRAPSIFFSIVSIFLFYFICRRLVRRNSLPDGEEQTGRMGRWFRLSTFIPVAAVFLFATENMSFVMGHIAMLDVFSIAFMLLGFLLYLRGNYLSCGFVMGLSMLCKAMALLAVLAIAIHLIITRWSEIWAIVRQCGRRLLRKPKLPDVRYRVLEALLIPLMLCITWVVLIPLLEYPATHEWVDPVTRTEQMLDTHLSLNDEDYGSPTGMATNPWKWLIWPAGIYYWHDPRLILSIGWTIWALVMPSMAYLISEVVRFRSRTHEVIWFALCWFIGVYGLLVVLKLLTGRLMYHFYFYPAIPAVCLATAWLCWRLWGIFRRGPKSRIIYLSVLGVYFAGTIATFVIMSPLGTHLVPLP